MLLKLAQHISNNKYKTSYRNMLTNRGLEAGLPGITADSRKKGMEADTYGATQASSIAKTNSTNEYEVLSNNIKKTDSIVDMLGRESAALAETPPLLRHAEVYKRVVEMGGQSSIDKIKSAIDKISGEKLPEFMDAMAQHQAMSSTGMRQKLAEIEAHTDSQELIGKRHDATQLAIANNKLAAATKAKQGVASIRNAIQSGKMNFEQAATAFRGASLFEADPELKALYETEADNYAKKVGEKGAVGKPDVSQLGVPSNQITPFNNKPKLSPEAQALYDKYKKAQNN
jgi:hypothetical protein